MAKNKRTSHYNPTQLNQVHRSKWYALALYNGYVCYIPNMSATLYNQFMKLAIIILVFDAHTSATPNTSSEYNSRVHNCRPFRVLYPAAHHTHRVRTRSLKHSLQPLGYSVYCLVRDTPNTSDEYICLRSVLHALCVSCPMHRTRWTLDTLVLLTFIIGHTPVKWLIYVSQQTRLVLSVDHWQNHVPALTSIGKLSKIIAPRRGIKPMRPGRGSGRHCYALLAT